MTLLTKYQSLADMFYVAYILAGGVAIFIAVACNVIGRRSMQIATRTLKSENLLRPRRTQLDGTTA